MVTLSLIALLSLTGIVPEEATYGESTAPWEELAQHDAQYPFAQWDEYRGLVSKWKRKKDRNPNHEDWVVRQVFAATHRQLLHKYHPESTLEQLMEEGAYDCVMGSWLLGSIYQELGFRVTVRELNFHTYLLVEGDQDTYLVEGTDPRYGVWVGPKLVHQQQANIKVMDLEIWQEVKSHPEAAPFLVSHPVDISYSLDHIAGLYAYNQAIAAWKQNDIFLAQDWLDLTLTLTPSRRSREFAQFIRMTTAQVEKQPKSPLSPLPIPTQLAGLQEYEKD